MASPSFVAISSIVAFSANDGAVSVSKPAGTAQDDLMVLFWFAGVNATSTLVPPAGWTAIDSVAASAAGYGWALYYKVAGGSEPASYSVQQTANTATADRAFIITWTGINTSAPINATGTKTTDNATTTPDVTSLATSAPDTTLVALCLEYSGAVRTISPPSGMTGRSQRSSADPCWDVADLAVASSGATGLKEFSSTSANYYTYAFAIASPGSPDAEAALSGSAVTSGNGTSTPGISVSI